MSSARAFNSDAEALVARAAELRPLLLRNAPEVERQRRLTEETYDALKRAGLFSAIAPRRWGGGGASLETMVRILVEVAKACPSTAWVLSIFSSSGYRASLFPDELQEELFADGVPQMCGVSRQGGDARPVSGGYSITGKWPSCTGSLHAQWAHLAVRLMDKNGKLEEGTRAVLRMSEVKVEDTWHVTGMEGTGSNTVVADDVFIPAHRLVYSDSPDPAKAAVNRKHSGEPSDAWPIWPTLSTSGLAPVVGMAERISELVCEGTRKKGIHYGTQFASLADSPIAQRDAATAALDIEVAGLIVLKNAQALDAIALAGRTMMNVERHKWRAYSGYVTRMVLQGVEQMMTLAGASAFAEGNPLHRYWRDVQVMSRHAYYVPHTAFDGYGAALLGGGGVGARYV